MTIHVQKDPSYTSLALEIIDDFLFLSMTVHGT